MPAPTGVDYAFQAREDSDPDRPRCLDVSWTEGDTAIEAELVARGYFPIARSFRVTCDSGVPAESRRLPTDRQLVASVERHPQGRHYLSWLMGGLIWEPKVPEADGNAQRQIDLYRALFASRADSDPSQTAHLLWYMLNEGEKTNDIVRFLQWRGMSRATAFRALRRLRDSAGEHDAE